MDMFQYLKGIYNVRNSGYSLIKDKRGVTASSPIDAHKMLLAYLYAHNKENCLVYENELQVIRNLGDVNNNEIKNFLSTVSGWDTLILSPYDGTDLEDVPGFTVLKKKSGSSTFTNTEVYIASSQFMEKVKNNNLSDLQIYVYTNPFLDSITHSARTDKYDICEVVGIQKLNSEETRYQWKEIEIS